MSTYKSTMDEVALMFDSFITMPEGSDHDDALDSNSPELGDSSFCVDSTGSLDPDSCALNGWLAGADGVDLVDPGSTLNGGTVQTNDIGSLDPGVHTLHAPEATLGWDGLDIFDGLNIPDGLCETILKDPLFAGTEFPFEMGNFTEGSTSGGGYTVDGLKEISTEDSLIPIKEFLAGFPALDTGPSSASTDVLGPELQLPVLPVTQNLDQSQGPQKHAIQETWAPHHYHPVKLAGQEARASPPSPVKLAGCWGYPPTLSPPVASSKSQALQHPVPLPSLSPTVLKRQRAEDGEEATAKKARVKCMPRHNLKLVKEFEGRFRDMNGKGLPMLEELPKWHQDRFSEAIEALRICGRHQVKCAKKKIENTLDFFGQYLDWKNGVAGDWNLRLEQWGIIPGGLQDGLTQNITVSPPFPKQELSSSSSSTLPSPSSAFRLSSFSSPNSSPPLSEPAGARKSSFPPTSTTQIPFPGLGEPPCRQVPLFVSPAEQWPLYFPKPSPPSQEINQRFLEPQESLSGKTAVFVPFTPSTQPWRPQPEYQETPEPVQMASPEIQKWNLKFLEAKKELERAVKIKIEAEVAVETAARMLAFLEL